MSPAQRFRGRIGHDYLVIGTVMRTAVTCYAGLVATFVALPLCSSAVAEQRQPRILLVEGHNATLPGGMLAFAAFKQRLKEKWSRDHDIYFDQLDLARFPGAEYEERLARFLGEKYSKAPPDVLVPNGRQSLALLV